MSGHTPGPWESGFAGGITGPTAVGYGRNFHPIAKPGGAGHNVGASVVAAVAMKDPNWEANARLIAAAPDMLKELRELAELDDDTLEEGDPALFGAFRDAARDLIVRIEGEQI